MSEGFHVLALVLSVSGFLITSMLGLVAYLLEKRLAKVEASATRSAQTTTDVEVLKETVTHLREQARGSLSREVFEERQRSQDGMLEGIDRKLDELERRKVSIPSRAGDLIESPPPMPPRPRLPSRPGR